MRTDVKCKCGKTVSVAGATKAALANAKKRIREEGCIFCRTSAMLADQRAKAQQRWPNVPPP